MRPIVVTPDKNGKISYTVEELQKLIDDVYAQGKADASTYVYPTAPCNPYNPLQPYVTWDTTKTAPAPSYGDKWTCTCTDSNLLRDQWVYKDSYDSTCMKTTNPHKCKRLNEDTCE